MLVADVTKGEANYRKPLKTAEHRRTPQNTT